MDMYFTRPRSSLPPPYPTPNVWLFIKTNFCAAQLGRCLRWEAISHLAQWDGNARHSYLGFHVSSELALSKAQRDSTQTSLSLVQSCPCIAPISALPSLSACCCLCSECNNKALKSTQAAKNNSNKKRTLLKPDTTDLKSQLV